MTIFFTIDYSAPLFKALLRVMSDFTKDLNSLSFENGLSEDEKELLDLRARSAALTFCGCAHAVFLCQLIHSIRSSIKQYSPNKHRMLSRDLRVGIVGLGHLGKKLLFFICEKTPITASNIQISTIRPENAGEHVPPGVECFFDNGRLAEWADVLFLCCLPSHLPSVCADLCPRLSRHTLVYSFTSAVPVSRLAQLLGHHFVLKSQYDITACATPGGLSLGLNWMCAVMYSLVNICTSVNVGSSETLSLINHLLKEKLSQSVELDAHSIMSLSCTTNLSADESFPWISVSDAQTKETTLHRFILKSKSTHQSISELELYTAIMKPP